VCTNPAAAQEFLPWGDTHWYAPIPGMSAASFTGGGWTLSGGARIVQTQLQNGATGTVLDLPSGAKAVGPIVCVTSAYPTARAWVRDVKGSEGVAFDVSYEGTSTWTTPKNTGGISAKGTSWGLPAPVNLQPYNVTGWQPMKITLIAKGTTSEFQVNDLELDPRYTY
jgi:hypothetical protein